MRLYLYEKEEFLDILWLDKNSMISCVLCTSIKERALLLAEKIPYEYWNKRILSMSLETRFCQGFFQVAKRLINQFLLFQYSCVYFSAKRRNSWTFYGSIKRAWLAVYKCQSKSPLVGRENPLWILKQKNFVNEFKNSVFPGFLPTCQKAHKPISIVSIFMRLYPCEKRNS